MMSGNGRDQLVIEDVIVIAKALTRITAWLDLSGTLRDYRGSGRQQRS